MPPYYVTSEFSHKEFESLQYVPGYLSIIFVDFLN